MTGRLSLEGKSTMYVSHGHFLAYDESESEPGSLWTEQHVAQGFVRRERALGIGTPVQYGNATLRVFGGRPIALDDYDRVVAIPLRIDSGVLCIEGPEEYPVERSVQVKAGGYRVIAAQSRVSDTALECDLFLEPVAETNAISQVLKADEHMRVSDPLLESGEVAP